MYKMMKEKGESVVIDFYILVNQRKIIFSAMMRALNEIMFQNSNGNTIAV